MLIRKRALDEAKITPDVGLMENTAASIENLVSFNLWD